MHSCVNCIKCSSIRCCIWLCPKTWSCVDRLISSFLSFFPPNIYLYSALRMSHFTFWVGFGTRGGGEQVCRILLLVSLQVTSFTKLTFCARLSNFYALFFALSFCNREFLFRKVQLLSTSSVPRKGHCLNEVLCQIHIFSWLPLAVWWFCLFCLLVCLDIYCHANTRHIFLRA